MVTRRQCCHSPSHAPAAAQMWWWQGIHLFKVLKVLLICHCNPAITKWEKKNFPLPLESKFMTQSDTAISLRTHQGLIAPQVTRPRWHPPAEMGFYEDWKLTRQVFPFKSVGIYIKSARRGPHTVQTRSPPVVRGGRNTGMQKCARHNSMGV